MALERWMLKHLETVTGGDFTSGLSRHPKIRICNVCKMYVIAGLDDEWRKAVVDMVTITAVGEAWALLDGRKTYRIYGSIVGRTIELWPREWWNVRGDTVGKVYEASGRVKVMTEHRCFKLVPVEYQESD